MYVFKFKRTVEYYRRTTVSYLRYHWREKSERKECHTLLPLYTPSISCASLSCASLPPSLPPSLPRSLQSGYRGPS